MPGAFEGDSQREALALASVERALDLDPALADAHGVMGAIHEANGRWADARREYEIAYQLNPLNDVQLFYLRFSRLVGDYEDAVRMGQRVVQLDPNNALAHNQLTVSYRFVRDFDAAVAAANRAISLSPGNVITRPGLAIAQILLGNYEAGVRELHTFEELGGNLNGLRIGQFALAYALANQPQEVERMTRLAEDRGDALNDITWVMVYLARGENQLALQRLQAAIDSATPSSHQQLSEIKANPWDLTVLESPEFRELRQRIGAFY